MRVTDASRFLVARSGCCIVGVAGITPCEHQAIGHSLAVVPGFRGFGLGRQLANSLLQWSAELGMSALFLFTCQAEFFFRAMGFSVIDHPLVPSEIYEALCHLCEPASVQAGHILHYQLESQSVQSLIA